MQKEQQSSDRLNDVELFVSKSLRVGVIISAAVIFLGLAFFIATGESGYPGDTYPTGLREILTGTTALKPFAVILTGLILLILTPVMRVGVSILVFVKEKDWLYVGISSVVFLILISSFFFGK